MEFKEVMERIAKVLFEKYKIQPKDIFIAKELGLLPQNYANLKIRNRIPYKRIIDFCGKHLISANWIFHNQSKDSLSSEEKFYILRCVDKINPSCGGGAFNDEDINFEYINLDKKVLMKLGYFNTNNLEGLKVIGDSMEPTLKDKDLILVDRSLNKYDSNNIYLVNTTSGLFIKRLKIHQDGEQISLISDNKLYLEYTLCVDEVTILGKVLGILELNNEQTVLDEEIVEEKEEKIAVDIDITNIKYITEYVELINEEYRFFTPDEDLQAGHDSYTDEPLYDLGYNQFYAIIMKCKLYDKLVENNILEIEASNCVLFPQSREDDDSYLFLFEDYYNFQYERAKLI